MINIETSYGNYCLTLVNGACLVGKNQVRSTIKAELWRDGQLITSGLAICHPTDKFDPRKGAHLAVNKLVDGYFEKHDARAIHKKVDSWFQ